jgi:hypothetical protein
MQYRIAQLADKIYIAQVQINSSENWFIIEKTGLVCYADTIENRKFCICTTLKQAEMATYKFYKRPKFQNSMYPVYHETRIWKTLN